MKLKRAMMASIASALASASVLAQPIGGGAGTNFAGGFVNSFFELLKTPVNVGLIEGVGGEVPLWGLIASFTIIFSVVYTVVSTKVPIFSGADKKGPAIAFSVAITAAAILTTPAVSWIVGILSLSTMVGLVFFAIAAIWMIVSVGRSGMAAARTTGAEAAKVSAEAKKIGLEAKQIKADAEAEERALNRQKHITEQATKFAWDEIKNFDSLEAKLKKIKEIISRAEAAVDPGKHMTLIQKALAEATALQSVTQSQINKAHEIENLLIALTKYEHYDDSEIKDQKSKLTGITTSVAGLKATKTSPMAKAAIANLELEVNKYLLGDFQKMEDYFDKTKFDITMAKTEIGRVEAEIKNVVDGMNTLVAELRATPLNVLAAKGTIDNITNAMKQIEVEFGKIGKTQKHLELYFKNEQLVEQDFKANVAKFLNDVKNITKMT